jgi:hypothetical protein
MKKLYLVLLLIFSAFMLFSGINFLWNTEDVSMLFNTLGYPRYIVVPLGVAKILGVVAIASRISSLLKELAFAGFFFDFMLAITSHLIAQDGMFFMPLIAVILLSLIYYLDKTALDN